MTATGRKHASVNDGITVNFVHESIINSRCAICTYKLFITF